MQIEKHKVVSFDYTLTADDGTVLDSSDGREPLVYLHGVGAIIAGLEKALEGQTQGDQLQVSVDPEDGYGERREALQAQVSREHFSDVDNLEVGMRFRVPTDSGDHQVVTVVEVAEETVTLDGNHPLAGENLHFDITVRDIRDATEEEIAHGHVHGPEGHEH